VSLTTKGNCCKTSTVCSGSSKCATGTWTTKSASLPLTNTTICACKTTGTRTCPTVITYTTGTSVCLKSVKCLKTGYTSGSCPSTTGTDASPHCCITADTGTLAVCASTATCSDGGWTTGMTVRPSSGYGCATTYTYTTQTTTGTKDVCFKTMSCSVTYDTECPASKLNTVASNCCNTSTSCSQGTPTTCNTSNWTSKSAAI